MSAICGFVNFDGKPASIKIGTAMIEKLKIYPAVSSKKWCENQVFLGCHHQIVTPESKFETLPMTERSTNLTITADAIIDNRIELMQSFAIPEAQWSTTTDSHLILKAYKKWGTQCPAHLIGDYAFVIWDGHKQELFCARDHVGTRSFYFLYHNNIFAFCTTITPLFELPATDRTLNDLWLADFLAIHTVSHELDYTHTIYRQVEQLPPAHTIVVKSNGLHKQKYWNPLAFPPIKFHKEADYHAAFKDIFFEAVHCRIRTENSVGIMLSGGLDSGSIACVAAAKLREQKKRLLAFSSIPMEGYIDYLPPGYLANESAYIEAVTKHCGNIDTTYCQSKGKNSVSDIEKFLSFMEQPYKTVENFFWLDNIINKAAKDNCLVLLNGQFGNSTISYGDFYTQIYTLFLRGHFITISKEISAYCQLHDLDRKKFSKHLVKLFLSRYFPTHKLKTHTFIKPNLAHLYNISRRLKKVGYTSSSQIYSLSEFRKLILNAPAFSHIGAIETKMSLAYNIAIRDPTRDKRLIEFCFRLPGNMFVQDGTERLLVRRAMKGILPDKVRLNTKERGIQSADWLQRISPIWNEIQATLLEKLQSTKLSTYVDVPEVIKTLDFNKQLIPKETDPLSIRWLLIILILAKYLEKAEEDAKERI